jgi:hypothetical protein
MRRICVHGLRELVAAIALAIIAISAQAQQDLKAETARLQNQGYLLDLIYKQLVASIKTKMDGFQCVNNLAHATITSMYYVNWVHDLIMLSAAMRDPSDQVAVDTKVRDYTKRAITVIESTREYIYVATSPCPGNLFLSAKALELHSITSDTLTILTQVRVKLTK